MKNSLVSAACAVSLGFSLLASPAVAQDEVEIRTVDLGHGLFAIYGQGGTMMASVGDDGVVVIDDQFAPLSERLIAAISELSDQPIRFLINTHFHGDHVGGNENFAATGAVIVAHDNVRGRMSVEQVNELLDRTTPPYADAALPVLTFTDGITLHWNDLTAHVIHFPRAHTDGDAVIWYPEANVIHMGDIFWNGNYPFLDVAGGGSIDGYINAMNWAIETADDDTVLIAGHGDAGGRHEAIAFRDMLVDARTAVQAQVDAGASLEDAQGADPLAAYNEVWGTWFIDGDMFTALIYLSLTAE